MAVSEFWRLKDIGNNVLGPIQEATGPALEAAITGIPPSTAFQINLGDGVWLDFTTPPAAGISAGIPAVPVGQYRSVEVPANSTGDRTIPIDLGPADPEKTMLIVVAQLGEVQSAKITAGGVEYPLEVVSFTATGARRLILLQGAVPVSGPATLHLYNTTWWSGQSFVDVRAAKVGGRATQNNAKGAMTAGTALTRDIVTQPGDHYIWAILSDTVPSSGGGFDAVSGVIEAFDGSIALGTTGALTTQIFIGIGTETVASNPRTLSATPNVTGNAARVSASFRSA